MTTMRSSPWAKSRTATGSSGHTIPTLKRRRPSAAPLSARPRLPRACRRSCQALPAATTPTRLFGLSKAMRFRRIGAGVGERGRELVVVEPLLLHERHVDHAGAEAARRLARPLGDDDRGRVRADMDCAAALGDVGDDFHADPAAGKARHRNAVQAEIDQLLGVRRIEDRHADGDERRVGIIDGRRRFRPVVVARERQRAALRRGAGEVGVAQRVARAVDARALAVPDPEHAIDRRAGKARHVLRAPDGGRSEILVQARAEDDVVPGEDRAGAPQFDVVSPHRGTAVAGNVAAGVEAVRRVAQALLDRQPHERLHPGHVEPALGSGPPVLESRLRAGERNRHASVLPRHAVPLKRVFPSRRRAGQDKLETLCRIRESSAE